MPSYDTIKNPNYVATVVSVEPGSLNTLPGLDNLRGYCKFGMQALTSKDTAPGLYLLFSTEVQLSMDFVRANNLHRDGLANADPTKTGYLEANRRVKAVKMRGHRSESLLMSLDSLAYMLSPKVIAGIREGDVFDSIDGQEVCRKYLSKAEKVQGHAKAKSRVRRVEAKVFPEHLDSENYFRNAHKIPADAHIVVSQKVHGTSVRYGIVPALAEQTWWEKLLRRAPRTMHRFVVGSRRVVKSVDLTADEAKNHYYSDGDLWTRFADHTKVADRIPKDHIVYGELIGFTGVGAPIQRAYTYDAADGTANLYVYRVAVTTGDGLVVDYSPAQMEQFCAERGFSTVPVLWSGLHADFVAEEWLERRFYDDWVHHGAVFDNAPRPLSDPKLVDEGVCIRFDGGYGAYIVKAKSPSFLVFESKSLDSGTADVEADADAEAAA